MVGGVLGGIELFFYSKASFSRFGERVLVDSGDRAVFRRRYIYRVDSCRAFIYFFRYSEYTVG